MGLPKLQPTFVLALAGLLSAGCSTGVLAKGQSCVAKPVQHFIGKAYSDQLRPELRRLSRAKDLRVWTPEMIVPARRGDRRILTISLTHDIDDPDARIYLITCGNY